MARILRLSRPLTAGTAQFKSPSDIQDGESPERAGVGEWVAAAPGHRSLDGEGSHAMRRSGLARQRLFGARLLPRAGTRAGAVTNYERRLAPFYPAFIVFGIACFVVGMASGSTWQRVIALVWLILVPLWLGRYRMYRREVIR